MSDCADWRFSLSQAWDSYRATVVPRNAGRAQVKAYRHAFYAGAESLLVQVSIPDFTWGDFECLHEELLAFDAEDR